MKSTQITMQTIMVLFLLGLFGWMALAFAQPEAPGSPRTTYEISVPPYKTDTERMIEAYERLSDQYLTLVQQHLAGMDDTGRLVLKKLDDIEKKMDALTQKVDALTALQSAPAPQGKPSL